MIWLVGCKGLLGREVADVLERKQLQYIGTDIEVDITDSEVAKKFVAQQNGIDWIINCAGYTAVDKAEDEPEATEKLNVFGPRYLGMAAEEIGARIIHVSTDYIFGSTGDSIDRPLEECDPAAPECVYGRTKLAGEFAIKKATRRAFIIRTAWLYGTWGKNFVFSMLQLFKERSMVKVVRDQIGCPTWSRVMAEFIAEIIERNSDNYGVYHFCGRGQASWYEFSLEIARLAQELGIQKKRVLIEPCTSDEFASRAKRPKWSVLSTVATEAAFGIKTKPWQESLGKFMSMINEQH
ncbi:dTDP-4-dehydrorhamnose reductase [Sediminispirochaeta bajacaliforniensis]|uniref:dTDP-4-dehydrorhamnose reductase n=1 Tax=Sediminispirochaeta bajacaliforniensis TaxID=148 RepID=UPI00036C75E1|nr:dTDP-4-dehydrorhamnose reductase [Sediminispirochaeta bajacaliforniensis]